MRAGDLQDVWKLVDDVQLLRVRCFQAFGCNHAVTRLLGFVRDEMMRETYLAPGSARGLSTRRDT